MRYAVSAAKDEHKHMHTCAHTPVCTHAHMTFLDQTTRASSFGHLEVIRTSPHEQTLNGFCTAGKALLCTDT